MANPFLSQATATNLIKSLCRQSSFTLARRVFDEMPDRDVVAWTAMISGYASNGRPEDAFATFSRMVSAGVSPNRYTVSSLLTSCRRLPSFRAGEAVHAVAVRRGIGEGAYVENALLELHASCGCIAVAEKVFYEMTERTVASWTSMIAGYTRVGQGYAGIRLFKQMIHEGAQLDIAFPCSIAIHACGSIGCVRIGQQLHALVQKAGHDSSLPVANSLLDMYSWCMHQSAAKQFFNEMPRKDLITWNAMIASFERSNSHQALLLFLEMESRDMQPNSFTFSSVVAACANLAILNFGRQVHAAVVRRGHRGNLQVANALIDMYAKCGSVADSRKLFDEMATKDLVTWTSMLIGYGVNGHGYQAIELFDDMTTCGVQPDHVLLMGVISACSHAGLVEQGLRYFRSMNTNYSVSPTREIYGCIVDLLGRAGRIMEAYELIKTMPLEPDETIWGALLGACKMHKNVYLGRFAAHKILETNPNEAKIYVLLSNIYAAGSAWADFAETRRSLRWQGNKKQVGMSWVEVRNEVCSFAAGDRSNPHIVLVYEVLGYLTQHMNLDESEFDSDRCKARVPSCNSAKGLIYEQKASWVFFINLR